MDRRVAVRGIFVHEGKLLCARLKPYESTSVSEFWCVPGGSVEPNEALLPALEREIIEETGVQPKIGSLLYLQQFAHNNKEHLEFFFHILNAADYRDIDLSATSHGAIEIAELTFIDPSRRNVLPKFLTTEPLKNIIATSPPVKIFNNLQETTTKAAQA